MHLEKAVIMNQYKYLKQFYLFVVLIDCSGLFGRYLVLGLDLV